MFCFDPMWCLSVTMEEHGPGRIQILPAIFCPLVTCNNVPAILFHNILINLQYDLQNLKDKIVFFSYLRTCTQCSNTLFQGESYAEIGLSSAITTILLFCVYLEQFSPDIWTPPFKMCSDPCHGISYQPHRQLTLSESIWSSLILCDSNKSCFIILLMSVASLTIGAPTDSKEFIIIPYCLVGSVNNWWFLRPRLADL